MPKYLALCQMSTLNASVEFVAKHHAEWAHGDDLDDF
jgi:hypothetical protein